MGWWHEEGGTYATKEVFLEVEVDVITVLLDHAQYFQRFSGDLGA